MGKNQVSVREYPVEVAQTEFPSHPSSTVRLETWTKWWGSLVQKTKSPSMRILKLKMCQAITLSSNRLKDRITSLMEDNRFKCIKTFKLLWLLKSNSICTAWLQILLSLKIQTFLYPQLLTSALHREKAVQLRLIKIIWIYLWFTRQRLPKTWNNLGKWKPLVLPWGTHLIQITPLKTCSNAWEPVVIPQPMETTIQA